MNGGSPPLGSCWSSPWEYIQLPNAAHADGSCQPYGSPAYAGCAAGSYALADFDAVWGAVRHFFTTESEAPNAA